MLAPAEGEAMPRDAPSDVVDFDADAVLAAANETVGEEAVLICVVYDVADFRTVYVDERVNAMYGGKTDREKHFGQIHAYVHLDFTEGELFGELFLDPDGIRAFVTYMGNVIAVRVVTDKQGVFLVVSPETPVTDLVNAVEDAMA